MLMVSPITQKKVSAMPIVDRMAVGRMHDRASQGVGEADSTTAAQDGQRRQSEQPARGAESTLVRLKPPRGGSAAAARQGTAASGRVIYHLKCRHRLSVQDQPGV
jgi:hypothetical protein